MLFAFPILLPDTQQKLMNTSIQMILLITLFLLFVKGYELKVLPAEENR